MNKANFHKNLSIRISLSNVRINNSFVCPATTGNHTKMTCDKCLRCFKGNKNVVFNLH